MDRKGTREGMAVEGPGGGTPGKDVESGESPVAAERQPEASNEELRSALAELTARNEALTVTNAGLSERLRDLHKEVHEREAMLDAVLESFPSGSLYVLDGDLRCVLGQGQGIEQDGRVPGDMVGKTPEEMYPTELADRIRPVFEQAFAGENASLDFESSGSSFELTASPMINRNGGSDHILVVTRDVTDKRTAAEALANMARFPEENPHPVLRVSVE